VGVVTSTDRAIEQNCSELVRVPGPSGQDDRRSVDPRTSPPAGVPPARLIALAGLSPAQALDIGAQILASFVKRSESDTHGLSDQVLIGMGGRVVLRRTQSGHPATSSASGQAAESLATVLTELSDAARHRAGSADPLLAELEQAIALVPLVDLRAVARRLDDACATIDRDGVRAELAALVRAIVGASGAITASGPSVGAPSAAAARLECPVGPRAGNRGHGAMRRIGAWLVSVALVVTIVLLEFAFLRDDILADVHLLLQAGRSGSVPVDVPESDGLPLVAPAPPAAGSVLAVDLRALDRCAPGAPCPMRVLVRLVSGAEPQTVSWSIRITDRCTVGTEIVPGGSVVVTAGEVQATAVGSVPLPQTASAVFAVTELPAVAASPPVLVGSCAPVRPVG